jgi:hypothetical protein
VLVAASLERPLGDVQVRGGLRLRSRCGHEQRSRPTSHVARLTLVTTVVTSLDIVSLTSPYVAGTAVSSTVWAKSYVQRPIR